MNEHPVAEFLQRLRAIVDVGCPEIYLEEDGDLAFEWCPAVDAVASLSLRRDGGVVYAFLIGDRSGHGRFHFTDTDWPRDLVEAIQAVDAAPAGASQEPKRP